MSDTTQHCANTNIQLKVKLSLALYMKIFTRDETHSII